VKFTAAGWEAVMEVLSKRKWITACIGAIAVFIAAKLMAYKKMESAEINKDNPYIINLNNYQIIRKKTVYERRIKGVLDSALSFVGLVVLSPLFLGISLVVFIDDPGPIFFTQKRIGKDGAYFMLHKFRTMQMAAPHDVPTHQLSDPEQYITRVGRWLRITSLDELPQIYDVFRGRMSVIGPRPALWNQDDLVKKRGMANTAMPGLTGLAQINGRDELEISTKADLDKKYVRALRKSSISGFLMDIQCFFGSIASVLRHDGVVEGGTGSLTDSSYDFQAKITRGKDSES